ncbi:MAG: endonuclease/exonuclease/phosphatase family protein [Planctomycetota bacterium]|nr:endonuclease/exonuclease/phosphatase family protein [Planctomycetota bacterium]
MAISNAALAQPALQLRPIAALGPGAKKEISGIVRSRTQPDVFWTINDSGDEPRVYPVRADGTVVGSERDAQTPGVLIGGAINSDWEDIAVDGSARLIVPDFGNNSNARRDLTLYILEEPEATAERTNWTCKIVFRYPDQPSFPAPSDNRNFDAEALFTVGDDLYILSKNRSDTFTKLYRVERTEDAGLPLPGRVTTLTYVDRFDLGGQATGADCSPDGLRLAVLTYTHVFLFERASLDVPFFASRVRARAYTVPGGDSDSESICFEDDEHLLIADEARGELFRVAIADIPEVRPAHPVPPGDPAHDLRVMSFNIRYEGANDGPNAWPRRVALVERAIRDQDPDVLGLQEVEAAQADWLRATFPSHAFHGVGRIDAARSGEFAPIMFRAERFTALASGHFWLSETPDVPGSKGWDGACERMASWVRLLDRCTGRPVLVLNTHLDHVGVRARREGLALIRARLGALAEGAPVIVTGDFNTSADGPDAAAVLRDAALADTFRAVYPARDADEATFSGWDGRIAGERIDWILAAPGLGVVNASIERRMDTGRTPSDHWPVTATLRWAPAQGIE